MSYLRRTVPVSTVAIRLGVALLILAVALTGEQLSFEGAVGRIQSVGEWVGLGMLSLVAGLVIAFRGLAISIARRRNGDAP